MVSLSKQDTAIEPNLLLAGMHYENHLEARSPNSQTG